MWSALLLSQDPGTKWEEYLKENPVEGFNKVMSYTQLRNGYQQYKKRRELCGSFDAFYADDSITSMMPRLLGKFFFKAKKQPVPVRLNRGSPQKALERARDATYLFLGWGTCR